jgi:hypothetical protein
MHWQNKTAKEDCIAQTVKKQTEGKHYWKYMDQIT